MAEGSTTVDVEAVRDAVVAVYREYYGATPEKADCHLVDDMLICRLEACFTKIERTLIERGIDESVHRLRRSLQRAMDAELRRAAQEGSGRKVRALLSQAHLNPDIDLELFVLEPAGPAT